MKSSFLTNYHNNSIIRLKIQRTKNKIKQLFEVYI